MSSLISVIIPTFNRAEQVKRAVQSVLLQTYSDLEVLVIDDGSLDNTKELIQELGDTRVRYFQTKNNGNYFARNLGIQEARGEYLAFLDSDDRFVAHKLQKQMDVFKDHKDLGLCCSNVYIQHYDIAGQLFEDAAHSFPRDFDSEHGFIDQALEGNFIATSTVLIRKECVRKVGNFKTQFQNAMDYEFFLRIVFNYPAQYLKEKLVQRLIHPAAVSKNALLTSQALLYIFTDCVADFQIGNLYSSQYGDRLQQAKQRALYLLGMEYLLKYDYEKALEYLNQCDFKDKAIFKYLAQQIARYRLAWSIPTIARYRRWQSYRSIHQHPLEFK